MTVNAMTEVVEQPTGHTDFSGDARIKWSCAVARSEWLELHIRASGSSFQTKAQGM